MADTVPTETLSLNYEEVKWTYSKSGDAGDSFDFKAEVQEQKVGLLLPAVQQVREPSTLPPDEEDQSIDSFKFAPSKGDGDVSAADALLIIHELGRRAADSDHDKWIDVLSTDWGTDKPGSDSAVTEGGLRSDGELVQAVSGADMGGDFIL